MSRYRYKGSAKVIEVIEVKRDAGCGSPLGLGKHCGEAYRQITEYYHKDGRLIARDDPCEEKGGA